MSSREDHRKTAGQGDAPVLTKTEARQAVTPHITRYVLVWGLGLVIVAFAVIYFVFRGHT